MISNGNFVNGTWKNGDGNDMVSYSPNNGEAIWRGHASSIKDVEYCVNFAQAALPSWSALTAEERIEFIRKFVNLVKENSEKLSESISVEIGKPSWEAGTEVAAISGKFDPSVEAYSSRNAEITRNIGSGISRTRFQPIGVVAVIGPYNFPLHMSNGHIIPALISGNVVILKPSEKGALTAELLMQLWDQAGLPKGVINMLQGGGESGEALVSHKGVNGVLFTGSYTVGEHIRKMCSTEKMCVLEMGGNSPLVVWDTSDIDAAVLATIQSAFITAGQRCSAARRLIVPNNSFGKEFTQKLIDVAKNLKVGKFSDSPEPFFGPLRSKEMVEITLNEQAHLVELGAKILLEAHSMPCGSCFISPGIIDVTDVRNKPDIEIIAPFIQLTRVNSFDEAITEANNTAYGLAAGVFTENKELYDEFSKRIRAGIVNWNQQLTGAVGWAPFGGVKKSGNYRPSGFLSADYCVYAVASIEVDKLKLPATLPKGIQF